MYRFPGQIAGFFGRFLQVQVSEKVVSKFLMWIIEYGSYSLIHCVLLTDSSLNFVIQDTPKFCAFLPGYWAC